MVLLHVDHLADPAFERALAGPGGVAARLNRQFGGGGSGGGGVCVVKAGAIVYASSTDVRVVLASLRWPVLLANNSNAMFLSRSQQY